MEAFETISILKEQGSEAEGIGFHKVPAPKQEARALWETGTEQPWKETEFSC